MNIEGSYTFVDAPREVVWETLMDPDALATALPGGEKLNQLNDNEYEAALNVRVGPVQGNFDGQIEIADVVPPHTYHMTVNGQGGPGFVNGGGDVKLEQIENDTLMTYAGEVQVGGRIAGVGQRLIESTARSIIRQGLETLDKQVQARVAVQPAAAGVAATTSTGTLMSEPTTQSTTSNPIPSASDLQGESNVDVAERELADPLAFDAESPERPLVAGPSANEVAARVARDVAGDVRNDFVQQALSPQYILITMVVVAIVLVIVLALLAQLLGMPFDREFAGALNLSA